MDAVEKKNRDSNLELFRILTMITIVVHHYVVNSGLMWNIHQDYPSFKSLFLLLLGWGGKTGINCFVLITGYYMCKSHITLKKGLKLLGEILFYNIAIFCFFTIYGYTNFSLSSLFYAALPIKSISHGFVSCYLIFFCFIPFLNILVNNMTKRQHLALLLLCFSFFCILPTLILPNFIFEFRFNYVGWFFVIYFIGSYLRLYQPFSSTPLSKITMTFILCLFFAWLSVLCFSRIIEPFHWSIDQSYFMVSDSNKPLAVITAVSAFLFFKKLNLKYNRFINSIAASTFGVLLIHANSDTMRQWLWGDILNNVGHYNENIYFHLLISVFMVYSICTFIDFLRIRYIEKPIFKLYDSLFSH